jgi:hypothetical protein
MARPRGRPRGSTSHPERHFGVRPPQVPKVRIAVQGYADTKYDTAISLFIHFQLGDDLDEKMEELEQVLLKALGEKYGQLEETKICSSCGAIWKESEMSSEGWCPDCVKARDEYDEANKDST